MGIKWKNRVKKWMAGALLGTLLIAPAAVSSVDVPQAGVLQAEAAQEQNELPDGELLWGSLAEGDLPGEDGDETGVMPCGDWEKEEEIVDISSEG